MLESDLLSPGRVLADVTVNSKKRLLELISAKMAERNKELNPREIFQSLCAREHLGSTALEDGVAIPHGRMSGTEPVEALFVKLASPLPYDDDDQLVDLVFALVVPSNYAEGHSRLLEGIAERFSDPDLKRQIRESDDPNTIFQLLSSPPA